MKPGTDTDGTKPQEGGKVPMPSEKPNDNNTQEVTGSLAETGSSSMVPTIGLIGGVAVVAGAGAVFTVRRRKAGCHRVTPPGGVLRTREGPALGGGAGPYVCPGSDARRHFAVFLGGTAKIPRNGSFSAPNAPSGTAGFFGATADSRTYATPCAGRGSSSPLLGQ